MALGAEAVQVGTAFLATRESAAVPAYREVLRSAAAARTVLTRALSGRLARGIPNRIIAEIEEAGAVAPFPVQNWLTGRFRPQAAAKGNTDLMSLWAGQSAPLLKHDTAAEVLAELLAGTR
jgi:nitronate monooxygenase